RSAEERRKQQEEVDRIKQLCQGTRPRLRIVRIEDQFAVLVGGYRDMEVARRALDDLKKVKPPSEKFMPKLTQVNEEKRVGESAAVHPFLLAFVVRNPVVPVEKAQDAPDPFLKELNSGESFSLLKTHKPWTLAVKSFQGAAVIQPRSGSSSFLDKIGLGGNS